MLSTAKAEAVARDLKETLEKRGFSVVESILAKGRKLAIGSGMSVRIEAKDGVSKDIFGNDNDAFTPHECKLAIQADAASASDVAKVMMDLGKFGFGIKLGEHATILATAEATADSAAEIAHNVKWPTKGA